MIIIKENKIPQVKNIDIGQQFIGKFRYGDMCRALGLLPEPSGKNSRKAQEKTLNQYIEYINDKETQIITIIDIYDKPQPREKKERTSKYIPLIELLLINCLYDEELEPCCDSHFTTSVTNFFKDIGAVNRDYLKYDYSECNTNDKKDKGFISYNLSQKQLTKLINDFRNISKNRLEHILTRALNKLEEKSIIKYDRYYTLTDSNNNIINTVNKPHLKQFILEAEQYAYNDLSVKYHRLINTEFLLDSTPNMREQWNDIVNEYLQENYGYSNCYKVLDITLTNNKQWIKKQIESLKIRNELNNIICESLINSITKQINNNTKYKYPSDTKKLANYYIDKEIKL